MREPTVFTLHLFQFQPGILKAYRQTCRSIHQPVPSAAMFRWRVRPRRLVEPPSVVIIEMRSDEPMFRPPIDRLLMDTEATCHFPPVQHSALAKPIIARAKAVGVHEIGYVLGRKAVSPLGPVARMRPDETLAR